MHAPRNLATRAAARAAARAVTRAVTLAALLAATGAAAALAACGPSPGETGGFAGTELTPAQPKHDFTLTDTRGQPYDFRAKTDGDVTLLYFGYTHCPDVCPVHMANIAAVMARLSTTDRARIRVVFVSTDPDRDTAPQLRAWLDNFDSSFVGLRGPIDSVNAIERSFGLAASIKESSPADSASGGYDVGHAAQVLAFSPDDSLRVVYPFGTRQQDWANDFPKLLGYKSIGPAGG